MSDEIYKLLEYVKGLRAVDFNAYKRETIKRRLERRLHSTGMPDYASYIQCLKENPEEIDLLIDSLTIKVSRFFRNPLVFEVLKEKVLPELVDSRKGETLRIWCAGCARGEEPYSVAIILKEITTEEPLCPPIFLLATDIDRQAVEHAKRGIYQNEALPEVKKGYLESYFYAGDGAYRLKDEISLMVTFACHDVTSSRMPSEGIFSDYHLILCRNVLIYFERELQEKVLKGLSDSLFEKGYLVLGEAESLPPQLAKDFYEIIPNTKIFRKGR
jgi:chemotaxis methyl-accepting protein methylase